MKTIRLTISVWSISFKFIFEFWEAIWPVSWFLQKNQKIGGGQFWEPVWLAGELGQAWSNSLRSKVTKFVRFCRNSMKTCGFDPIQNFKTM
jgi:hypothetical protein